MGSPISREEAAALVPALERLIRQTFAVGLAEGDPLCLALAGQVGDVQRRAAGPHDARRVVYLNPAWKAWTTPGWSARYRLSYTVFGPRKGVARRVPVKRTELRAALPASMKEA